MKISVLINSRNRIEPLTRCLASVFAQDYPDFEVVVLDDASDQYYLANLLTARFKTDRLRCLRVDTPLGVAGSRNLLMEHATGDIFFIIDDDAFFADIQALRRVADLFQSYPQAGICASKIIDHRPGKNRLLIPFSQRIRRQHPLVTQQFRQVSYFLGGGHAVHRRVVDSCGAYNPLLTFGEEELDLSYRAIEAGFEIYYLPEIVIHHYPQPSVVQDDAYNQPELYHHVRNRFFLAYKYLPLKYVPTYLLIWLTKYGRTAIRQRAIYENLGGIWAGIQLCSNIQRTPLSSQTIAYLRVNFGRLWY